MLPKRNYHFPYAYSPEMRTRLNKSWASDRQPTIEMASAMPLSVQEMSNDSLVTIAATGNHPAREEVLKRHIMGVRIAEFGISKIF